MSASVSAGPRFVPQRAHSPTFFVTSSILQYILQSFRRFTYVTAHSPILPLLHLHHRSFSNTSFASPMSQALHLMSPGEPPMLVQKFLLSFLNINSLRARLCEPYCLGKCCSVSLPYLLSYTFPGFPYVTTRKWKWEKIKRLFTYVWLCSQCVNVAQ